MAATLVIWHGYLLGATGSNIYTRNLVDSWLRAGHDVVLVCQERDPTMAPWAQEEVDLVLDPATGRCVAGPRRSHAGLADVEPPLVGPEGGGELPLPGRCTLVRPDIHGRLPVYVRDRYEGFEVTTFVEATDDDLARYSRAQAAAARWVVEAFAPTGVLVNHAVPLPAAVGPVFDAAGVPYAVKVHGSELEYAIAHDERYVEPARAGLAHAASVLVGSGHIAARTAELLGGACIEGRVNVVPPGVDLEHFVPLPGGSRRAATAADRAAAVDALAAVLAERERAQPDGRSFEAADAVARAVAGRTEELLPTLGRLHGTYEERHVDRGAATAAALGLAAVHDGPVITFVGKLIPQKGVHALIAALPIVAHAHPDVRLLVAGFGPLRDGLEALAVALGTGARAAVHELARGMGALAGGAGPLPELTGLLDVLDRDDSRAREYWLAAERLHERITWLGLVDHGVLARSWPLTDVSVVPSILAEAFGMVAAEAAACGSVPVVADHSGLADAAAVIELGGVAPVRFDSSDPSTTVEQLAAVLVARLDLGAAEAARQATQARANVAGAWGWDALAVTVAACMQGQRTRAGI